MKKVAIFTLVLLLALSGCAKTPPETTTAPTTKPTEPEPTIPDGATLLTKEELADFQAMMEQDYSVQDASTPKPTGIIRLWAANMPPRPRWTSIASSVTAQAARISPTRVI